MTTVSYNVVHQSSRLPHLFLEGPWTKIIWKNRWAAYIKQIHRGGTHKVGHLRATWSVAPKWPPRVLNQTNIFIFPFMHIHVIL